MSVLTPILKKALFSPFRIVVTDDTGTYSYLKLISAAYFLAKQINKTTDQKHIGILLPTSGAFPIAMIASWITGKVIVPLNYLLKPEELDYVINDSQIDTIITLDKMTQFLNDTNKNPLNQKVHGIPDRIKLIDLKKIKFKGIPPFKFPHKAKPQDLAAILYTSGTSGKPKGVMLSHRNLRSNIQSINKHIPLNKNTKFLGVLPQFHAFGLTALTILPLSLGAQAIYSAKFVPRKIIELIKKHKPTIMIAVPSMYGALLTVKKATPQDLQSIRYLVSGAEPLSDAINQKFKEKFNLQLCEGYGLTETSPVTTWALPQTYKKNTVGITIPDVQTFIIDKNKQILPHDQEGEILIAGPNVMLGYFNLKKQTQEAFTQLQVPNQGNLKCFITGDIGKKDKDGQLYITGRKKEMLIIGGENVFPREIEEVLNQHPSVLASAVIGKKDELRGETPIAFIQTHPDATFDPTALKKCCREKLAGYKIPKEIIHIQELPRNPTGKIMRRELKIPQ